MKRPQPPQWMNRILRWYCHPEYLIEIEGDLLELYGEWIEQRGKLYAKITYLVHTLLFMRAYNSRLNGYTMKSTSLLMLGHFVKISIRNFLKHKAYNVANLIGLTVGITVSLIMLLHIRQELSYEKDYPKHDRIVRLEMSEGWAKSSPMFADEFKSFFSQTENIGRFARYSGGKTIINAGERQFISEDVLLSDQANIEIFDYQFISGFPEAALVRPYTIVLVESLSIKLFGREDPVGKVVELDGKTKFEVTGVIQDLPTRSHIKAEMLISMPTFYDYVQPSWLESRGWMVMYTYALFRNTEDMRLIEERMPEFFKHYIPDEVEEEVTAQWIGFTMMPLTDIHLRSNKVQEMGPNSDVLFIYIFASLALVIIIIASVNFINIFTALVLARSREVGLRKSIGASRGQIITQILAEATFSVFLSIVAGGVGCLILLPYYSSLTGTDMAIDTFLNIGDLSIMLCFGLVLGVLSGVYPAWLISGTRLTVSMAKNEGPDLHISTLRKGLIVFQFLLSFFVLTGTLAINRQMNFISSSEVGYNADRVVALPSYGKLKKALSKNKNSVFAQLTEQPEVSHVCLTSTLIGEPMSVEGFRLASAPPEEDHPSVNYMWADENYVPLMGIELSRGRNFNSQTDTSVAFIVNQKLVDLVQDDPLGEVLEFRGEQGEIVGILENFNYYSLHQNIEPLAICYKPGWTNKLLVKLKGGAMTSALTTVEHKIKAIDPNFMFHYTFLEDHINSMYEEEYVMARVFKVFSVLALIICCVGLLGLAAIELRRRTKELGIRRVLGAGISQILVLLSRQFVIMLLIALVLAVPLSYVAIHEWLSGFSYASGLTVWVFLLPALMLFGSTVILIGLSVMSGARTNPVDALKSE